MCGGWRQNTPDPYRLVLIRELVIESGQTKIDLIHVGYWGVSGYWFCLQNETEDGTKLPRGTFKGTRILNIYGWKPIHEHDQNH